MKRRTLSLIILSCILIAVVNQKTSAQDTLKITEAKNTGKEKKEFKNTVHVNVTNPLIFGDRAIIFGYERITGKHQSFTVNIGLTDFPTLHIIDSDSLKAKTVLGESGMHFSVDYRFYLAKENKYQAPHGIYLAPYMGFNNNEKNYNWSLKSVNGGPPFDVASKTKLSVFTVGLELGYQFILWDRLSLDLVLIGPGIAWYNLKTSLGDNLSEADKQKFFEKLDEALTEKYPGYGWTIGDGDFEKDGSTKTTSFGYRYMVQVGFRF